MRFCLYNQGGKPMSGISLDGLLTLAREQHCLMARAENSGCEGCYVEVARWNQQSDRWERYAFEKLLEGQGHHRQAVDGEPETCWDIAQRVAQSINEAAKTGHQSLIHHWPTWEQRPVPPQHRYYVYAICTDAEGRTEGAYELCLGSASVKEIADGLRATLERGFGLTNGKPPFQLVLRITLTGQDPEEGGTTCP